MHNWMAVNTTAKHCAELENASANSVILDDSALFHSHTSSDKLHHAPQTDWYVYKWQTAVSEAVATCLHIPLERISKEEEFKRQNMDRIVKLLSSTTTSSFQIWIDQISPLLHHKMEVTLVHSWAVKQKEKKKEKRIAASAKV